MKINFSIYLKNHIDKTMCIDNNIVDSGVMEFSTNQLYGTLSFSVADVFIHNSIVGDLTERIFVKYKIDEKPYEQKFVIDKIDYLKDKVIKIYAKTKEIYFSSKYMGELNTVVKAPSLKELIATLIPNSNVTNLSDVEFDFDYTITDKSYEDVIKDLQKITLFEYSYNKGMVYFYDKPSINKDDGPVIRVDERDIISFSTSSNKDTPKISKLYLNVKEQNIITAEPKLNLIINDSPQCCSPDEVVVYEDESGNTYRINPVNAYFILYYTPLLQTPTLNLQHEKGDRVVVEEFVLNNDEFVVLSGGIKTLKAIDGVENMTYEKGFNVITFDKVEKGILKITYLTEVLHGVIEHSKYPKDVNIISNHYNQEINHTHKIELNGYYPIPYTLTLSLVKDFGIDYGDAIGVNVLVNEPEYSHTIRSNQFGEISLKIEQYGVYSFVVDGKKFYLNYFINKFEITADEINE